MGSVNGKKLTLKILDAARIEAEDIAANLDSTIDPSKSDMIAPTHAREAKVAVLPYEQYLTRGNILFMPCVEIDKAAEAMSQAWRKLLKTVGELLSDNTRHRLNEVWEAADEDLHSALRKEIKVSKVTKTSFNLLNNALKRASGEVGTRIQERRDREVMNSEMLAKVLAAAEGKKLNGGYPAVNYGSHAKSIGLVCNRNAGTVEIRGAIKAYVSPTNNGAWKVITLLAESVDPNGFEAPEPAREWQSSFNSKKRAKVPANLAVNGFVSSNELLQYIQREGHTGRYHFVTYPK